jgi:glutaredoxin-like protein
MSLFTKEMKGEIQRRLDALPGTVKMVFFNEFLDCEGCEPAELLFKELAGMSDKLTLETHNRLIDEKAAAAYGVDKSPALVLEGPAGARVRFYGVPGGYEFAALLEGLVDAAAGKASVTPESVKALSALKDPVHIQVFVTPTCPFCSGAARTAHKLATAFPQITADVVEAGEFPELSRKYGVSSVPKIVINDKVELVGAVPEARFAEVVLKAVA